MVLWGLSFHSCASFFPFYSYIYHLTTLYLLHNVVLLSHCREPHPTLSISSHLEYFIPPRVVYLPPKVSYPFQNTSCHYYTSHPMILFLIPIILCILYVYVYIIYQISSTIFEEYIVITTYKKSRWPDFLQVFII